MALRDGKGWNIEYGKVKKQQIKRKLYRNRVIIIM